MTNDPLTALAQSSAAIVALEAVVAHQARECRRAGHSWTAIAEAAGVSKATALTKWKESDMTTAAPTTSPGEWTLAPGDTVRRRDLHREFGGNIQSGISPSRRSDHILLFASPRGADHGYADGPNADGTYSYTGEGQRGDQEMARGNKAIRDHRATGKSLRLFEGDGTGTVTYIGEFEYDTHRTESIPGTGTSGTRIGIVFTLRPAGPADRR